MSTFISLVLVAVFAAPALYIAFIVGKLLKEPTAEDSADEQQA